MKQFIAPVQLAPASVPDAGNNPRTRIEYKGPQWSPLYSMVEAAGIERFVQAQQRQGPKKACRSKSTRYCTRLDPAGLIPKNRFPF